MRRLLALGALLLALPVLGPMPAGAQDAPSRRVDASLVSQTPWLLPAGSFELHLRIDGAEGGDELELTLGRRITSRSVFAQSLEGRVRGTTRRFAPIPIAEIPSDERGNQVLSFPLPSAGLERTPLTLPSLSPGIYPLAVAVRDDGGALVDRFVTHVVRVSDDEALVPLSVGWVQPLSAPPAVEPDGAVDLGVDAERAVSTVLGALGRVPELPLTLDVAPETLAAAGAGAAEVLRASLAGGAQLLASPYVRIDVTALVAAGASRDLLAQREQGEEVLTELLGTPGGLRTWVTERAVTPAALSSLRTIGVTRVVLPEQSLVALEPTVTDGTTLTRPFAVASGSDELLRAAALDPGLQSHFRGGDDQVLAAHQLLADLAVLFFDLPGTPRGVVVRPPERWRPTNAFLGTVLPAIARSPVLRPVTLETLFEEIEPLEDRRGPVVRTLAGNLRAGGLPAGALRAARRAVTDIRQLAGPGADVTAGADTRYLAAESWLLSGARRRSLLRSIVEDRDRILTAIELPDRRIFRLTAREGTIPLTLVNDNPFTVDVALVLSSDKLEFLDAADEDRQRHRIPLALAPGTHTLTVPVRTRASGTFPVQAALLTAEGDVLRRGRFTITSSAFSGVGIVLSIGAGVFLLAWWARHWRTARRDRRLVEAPK